MATILGISAFYHDSAAALLRDGQIVAAAQEERFTRRKHDPRFPLNAARYCLEAAGTAAAAVDHVVFYEKPLLKFERLLETYVGIAPSGFGSFVRAMPLWLKEKLFQKSILIDWCRKLDPEIPWAERLLFAEHHESHAASAFFPSPFDTAAVLTMDGVGEWTTTSIGKGEGGRVAIAETIDFPHSLGLLYSAFTFYCGFKVNSGEYKLMGLAPYGEPRYAGLIRDELIDLKPDGSFRLALEHFDYVGGLRMTNERFAALFGGPARGPDELLTQRHMDIAASIQRVTEDAVAGLAGRAMDRAGSRRLCLAGGVALNCVANGRLLADRACEAIWVQPAAGDAGGALGAALAAHHHHLGAPRRLDNRQDAMAGAYLGPSFTQADVEARLEAVGARFEVADEAALLARTAARLAEGAAVGWFQGRMEFGPRALGARSILGDPRSPAMQKTLNLKIKYRESFRPFAPSVLREDVVDWFELDTDSPYMLLVAGVRPERRIAMGEAERQLFGIEQLNVARSDIPAVTHVDYSARVQTVHRETNPRYHRLITAFKERTGCPVLVNTSFNIRGEPIVCTPEDAFRCFMGCELDLLVVENCILAKHEQDQALRQDYRGSVELD